MIKGRIEYWTTVHFDSKEYFCVIGIMNGEYLRTSRVVKIENGIVATLNSQYELGLPMYHRYDENLLQRLEEELNRTKKSCYSA